MPSLYYCVKIFVLLNVSLYEKLHTTFQWLNWAKDEGSGLWNYTLIKSSILQISSTVPDEFIKISKWFQINKHSEHKWGSDDLSKIDDYQWTLDIHWTSLIDFGTSRRGVRLLHQIKRESSVRYGCPTWSSHVPNRVDMGISIGYLLNVPYGLG